MTSRAAFIVTHTRSWLPHWSQRSTWRSPPQPHGGVPGARSTARCLPIFGMAARPYRLVGSVQGMREFPGVGTFSYSRPQVELPPCKYSTTAGGEGAPRSRWSRRCGGGFQRRCAPRAGLLARPGGGARTVGTRGMSRGSRPAAIPLTCDDRRLSTGRSRPGLAGRRQRRGYAARRRPRGGQLGGISPTC